MSPSRLEKHSPTLALGFRGSEFPGVRSGGVEGADLGEADGVEERLEERVADRRGGGGGREDRPEGRGGELWSVPPSLKHLDPIRWQVTDWKREYAPKTLDFPPSVEVFLSFKNSNILMWISFIMLAACIGRHVHVVSIVSSRHEAKSPFMDAR